MSIRIPNEGQNARISADQMILPEGLHVGSDDLFRADSGHEGCDFENTGDCLGTSHPMTHHGKEIEIVAAIAGNNIGHCFVRPARLEVSANSGDQENRKTLLEDGQ